MEKAEADRLADGERVRADQLIALNEMKQLAEQAKASVAAGSSPPPGLRSPHSRASFASTAPTATPGNNSLPHELRTEAILAGMGEGLSSEESLARATDVLQRAGVHPSTHDCVSSNLRGKNFASPRTKLGD